jgi:hypothetical protein
MFEERFSRRRNLKVHVSHSTTSHQTFYQPLPINHMVRAVKAQGSTDSLKEREIIVAYKDGC